VEQDIADVSRPGALTREFGEDNRDEVLDFHIPGQPGIHLLGELDQVGLGEGELPEDGQHRGAQANRVQPFALDVTDDKTRPVLCHRDVIKIAPDHRLPRRRLIVRGEGHTAEFGGQRPQDRLLDSFTDADKRVFPAAADYRREYSGANDTRLT
jgi:hypothetical protein